MADRRCVALGVTGSIAAYKAAQLTSNLQKKGYDVHVLMTKNATELVAPLTFETLSGNRVSVDTFDRNFEWNVQHIALAKRAEVFVIAPATANFIAKMACGIADDMLTSTVLAARCEKLVCPAMNTGMYDNAATQQNLETLRGRGVRFVEPETGLLACGDEGKGRLADLALIEDAVACALEREKPLAGRRVLITAGATREAMDPVRFITNHSTGKMGYALARAARNLGAAVTLIASNTALADPFAVSVVRTSSAAEMRDAVLIHAAQQDVIIKAAAVADYRPAVAAEQKLKKKDGALTLALERTDDILALLGASRRPGQVLCGFSMETQDLLENSREKLEKKGCDMIVANSISTEGAGFGVDTNVATLITREGAQGLPLMSKDALARVILMRLAAFL